MPSNLPFSHKKESSESSLGGSADNSYLCMTPSPSAANGSVLTRSGSSLSSKKPERSQSFITHVQQPTPTIESSPYLDMAPATTVTAATSNSSSPYLDMKPANNTNSDSAYLDMPLHTLYLSHSLLHIWTWLHRLIASAHHLTWIWLRVEAQKT